MEHGGWIPISKWLAKSLPTDRPFTEIEAIVSLQLDYDNSKTVSVNGYSVRWQWSRGKVRRFLDRIGIEICYPESTSEKQNQNGQIVIQIADRSNPKREQIRFIDSKCLANKTDRSSRSSGQIADRSQDTTIYPNTDPKEKVPFSEIINALNSSAERRFRLEATSKKPINARWNEGYRINDFLLVIKFMCAQWLGTEKFDQYLRPSTLFNGKFGERLVAAKKWAQKNDDQLPVINQQDQVERQAKQEALDKERLSTPVRYGESSHAQI